MARSILRCSSLIVAWAPSRNRGLVMISPSEVTKNRATPTSMPAVRPVDGNGSASVSVITITNQRRCSRLTCNVLIRPTTCRC